MADYGDMFYGTLPQDTQDFRQVLAGIGRTIRDRAIAAGQRIGQSGQEAIALQNQIFGDPNRPLRVTDPEALRRFTDMIMGGPLGFAPAGIVAPAVARQLRMPTNLPADETFTKAVQNTPGAQVTQEGLLMRVQRSQKPEQAGEESVRTGVFYLPEGSASAKYYKQGKSSEPMYGGPENIAGETLYKNPIFVKGATGGKAPEAAYDQLMGKGAYQKMRSDVLQAANVMQPGLKLDRQERIERIKKTLEEYGSNPVIAESLIENSKKGNQLAYAMQENIVAHAVRKAGYDAILGYSKKKTGDPFLSEIFDVREAAYPTRQGDFRLREEFQSLLD